MPTCFNSAPAGRQCSESGDEGQDTFEERLAIVKQVS